VKEFFDVVGQDVQIYKEGMFSGKEIMIIGPDLAVRVIWAFVRHPRPFYGSFTAQNHTLATPGVATTATGTRPTS